MATAPAKVANNPFMLGMSGVGPEVGARLRVPNHFVYDNSIATISPQYPDGVAVIDLPCGAYTYRMMKLFVTNSAAIAGKTFLLAGKNIVNTANLADYISRIQIEINGKVEVDYYIDEMVDLDKLFNYDTKNGFLIYAWGSPNWFRDEIAEDAYLLGTGNIASVRILVTLKTAWATGTMKLNCGLEYAPVNRPIGYLQTNRRTRYAAPAVGDFTVSDLPHGVDLASIWVRSINGVECSDVDFDVDQRQVFYGSTPELRSLSQVWGKDIESLPVNDVYLDFWREMDAGKGLAALASLQQIRRNAVMKLTLKFSAANAQFYAITHHCGPYQLQR